MDAAAVVVGVVGVVTVVEVVHASQVPGQPSRTAFSPHMLFSSEHALGSSLVPHLPAEVEVVVEVEVDVVVVSVVTVDNVTVLVVEVDVVAVGGASVVTLQLSHKTKHLELTISYWHNELGMLQSDGSGLLLHLASAGASVVSVTVVTVVTVVVVADVVVSQLLHVALQLLLTNSLLEQCTTRAAQVEGSFWPPHVLSAKVQIPHV